MNICHCLVLGDFTQSHIWCLGMRSDYGKYDVNFLFFFSFVTNEHVTNELRK